MGFTKQELDSFHRFACTRASNGSTEMTLEDCLHQWRQQCDREETMASIQRSLDDIAAGRVQTLEEVDEEIRREFGFKPRAK